MTALHDHCIHDALSARPTRDPTRCTDLRQRLDTLLRRSVTDWRVALQQAILKQDSLGLGSISPHSWGPAERLERLASFARAASEHIFPKTEAIQVIARTVYVRGYRKAYEEFDQPIKSNPTNRDVKLYVVQIESELTGIIEASIQQITRTVALGVSSHESPRLIWVRIRKVLEDITLRRSQLISRGIVSQIYNHAKLNAYSELEVKSVGIVPETVSKNEAVSRQAYVKRDSIPITDVVIPFHLTPGGRTEERVVLATAGDDRVCPICEDLEGKSYDVLDAYAVIPVHINCRCTWIPFEDARGLRRSLRSERG